MLRRIGGKVGRAGLVVSRDLVWAMFAVAFWMATFIPIDRALGVELPIPNGPIVVLTGFILLNSTRVRSAEFDVRPLAVFLLAVLTHSALCVVVADESGALQIAKSNLNLVAAICSMAAVACIWAQTGAFAIRTVCRISLVVVVMALAYEAFLSPGFFEPARELLYGSAYSAIDRDLFLWGVRRPIFLFKEPSFAGIFCLVLLLVESGAHSACQPPNKGRAASLLRLCGYTLIVFAVLRSVTVVLAPIVYAGCMTLERLGRNGFVLALALIAAAGGYLFSDAVHLGETLSEVGYSSGGRFQVPAQIILRQLESIWFTGQGLGWVPDEYVRALNIDLSALEVNKFFVTNSLLEYFIYFGITVGLFLFMLQAVCLAKFFRSSAPLLVFVTALLWSVMGGVATILNWVTIAYVVLGTNYILNARRGKSRAA